MPRSCILVYAAVALCTGVTAVADPADTALNEWCPVMTEEKADPQITTEYRGVTVAFCCDTCLKKFLANPVKYEGRLVQLSSTSMPAAGEGDVAHDHEHPPGDADDEREPLLGRLHPIIVHFPIAGLPLALLGFAIWMTTGREAFARADVPPLFAAMLAAIASVITGNIAHDAMRFSETLHIIVERHQFVSTAVMVLAIVLSVIRLWRWNRLSGMWRWAYASGLLIACGLLGFTGYLGGSLVFGPDHLGW